MSWLSVPMDPGPFLTITVSSLVWGFVMCLVPRILKRPCSWLLIKKVHLCLEGSHTHRVFGRQGLQLQGGSCLDVFFMKFH